MKSEQRANSRRAFIGAILTSAFIPRSVLGQLPKSATEQTGASTMQIRCAFDRQNFTATLLENPSAHDFASMLPLDLAIEDYANNEKIAYLPRKLTEDGVEPFSAEAPGDFCYYAPWGNVVFFYDRYRYSNGLIRLGRLDEGIEPLLTRGKFPLRIELVS